VPGRDPLPGIELFLVVAGAIEDDREPGAEKAGRQAACQGVGGTPGDLVGAEIRSGCRRYRDMAGQGRLDQVVVKDGGVQLGGDGAGQGTFPAARSAGHLDQQRLHRAAPAGPAGRQRTNAGALTRRGEYPSNRVSSMSACPAAARLSRLASRSRW
jgi:hypothetical protein